MNTPAPQWYIQHQGKTHGPFTSAKLKELVDTAKVSPATLIRKGESGQWIEAGKIQGLMQPGATPSAAAARPAGTVAKPAGAVAKPAGAVAKPAGAPAKPAPAKPAAPINPYAIQANPHDEAFWGDLEKSQAPKMVGAPTPAAAAPTASGSKAPTNYAGFWLRGAALLIDGVVLMVLGGSFGFVAGFGMGLAGYGDDEKLLQAVGFGLGLIIQWAYYVFMESSNKMATVGKSLLGLVVTDMDGRKIGFGRANGRFFGKYLSAFTFGIGLIMAGFTQKKQTLHDMITSTLVSIK
jgi:uncharacterized RDD family membrane protein YckC